MEVIISHSNTDFDGLASMLAAKKLYPDAEMVFTGKLCRNVEDFMALHKDTLNIRMGKDIPLDQVNKLILVDTKTKSRLGALQKAVTNPGVVIHIYDHHPRSEEDLQGELEVVETVGAATTLLVELIREAGADLSPLEATILALGIYEDTGCLTFSSSTARDATAVAYLLEKGANLKVIGDFIGRPLSEPQKNLLNTLILASEHYLIHGTTVLVATASVEDFIGGLALLTHKLADIESVDVIIAVVEMEDRLHLVGRSRSEYASVLDILEPFGGRGHDKAASSTLRDVSVAEVLPRLHQVLQDKIRPLTTAAQLMSAPVKTVFPDTTIDEAGKIMLRYGHSGLPVVSDSLAIIGIVSRRDVDKAKHHGLGHAPVKGYMSRRVVSIGPELPLPEIQRILIDNNIGRLPVVEEGRLLGIVSRTDVLRSLHGDSYPEKSSRIYLPEGEQQDIGGRTIRDLMLDRLPPSILEILGKVYHLACHKDYKVYVVGGFVRDLLLGVENSDIDLVVEGDGISFARVLADYFFGRVRIHEKFGTAMVVLPNHFKIDVATARTEFYEYPAALPKVETSTLKEDLYRRDFTINTMAINLSGKRFGELVDYFGARKDLEAKTIRILYTLSFVEDPTRVFRAVRFEQRYDFTMEAQTLELAKKAIRDRWLQKLSYDRIREEIKHTFNEEFPIKAITRMRELGLWQTILPEITVDEEIQRVVDSLPQANKLITMDLEHPREFHPWLTYFAAMVHKLSGEQVQNVCERLKLSGHEIEIIRETVEKWEAALALLEGGQPVPLSVVSRALGALPKECCAFILAKAQSLQVWELLKSYLERVSKCQMTITGNDLKTMGCPRGPVYGRILQQVYEALLDNELLDHQAQLKLAEELVKKALAEELEPKERGVVLKC
ncbi:MAG TPA: CBS domain-containing protein [Bacillota bacterium]|nr:CBS domain-containing protein [Bacillota bacterium]